VAHGLGEEPLVHAGEASHLPVAKGDLLDEQVFDVGGRFEGLAEAFEVEVEGFLALDDAFRFVGVGAVADGDDGVLGEEPVAGGVLGSSGFAFGGFGSGGMFGVALVGGELLGGDGDSLFLWSMMPLQIALGGLMVASGLPRDRDGGGWV
jgi:hypothetical protein